MKGPARLGQFLTAAIALSTTVAAWPEWLPAIDALVVRQDDSSSSSTATSTASPASTASSATKTSTKGPITTDLNTGGATQTGSKATATGTGTGSNGGNSSSSTMFDPQSPAGGVTMLEPKTTAGVTQLYKLGETITWQWNYTSLLGTPSAVDVLVSASTASATWTLTQNMTFEPTATYVWDTKNYTQENIATPLLVAMYTLLVYDAESSFSATPDAGYLAPFSGFQFGLYTPQPYKPLGEWQCATCSAGNGDLDRKALGFAFTMSMITVLSFTWFVTGRFGALL